MVPTSSPRWSIRAISKSASTSSNFNGRPSKGGAMAEEKQNAPIEPQPTETTTALRDKRITPEGVVPKQAQGYVIAGLAVLILMAVMFSKNHAKPAAKTTESAPLAVSTDMNQRKIQELEQDLSADQRQSQQQAQRTGVASSPKTAQTATNPA